MKLALAAEDERFEQRPDGLWEFRDDALNRIFASAAYRRAKELAAHHEPSAIPGAAAHGIQGETPATRLFCHAATVSPATLEAERKRGPPPAWMEPLLAKALSYCLMPGGFRTRSQHAVPGPTLDESWWVYRPLMTDAELFQRVKKYHDAGNYLECSSLASQASGHAQYELRAGAWMPRTTGVNRLAASCDFQKAVRDAEQDALRGQDPSLCLAYLFVPDVVRAGLADSRLSNEVRESLKRALAKCPVERAPLVLPPFRDP
jgi:hypothetical protein